MSFLCRAKPGTGPYPFQDCAFDGLTPTLCGSSQGQAIIHRGIDCLQALRDAMGPEVLPMVDCHWRMDEARALSTLALLEPVDLHWFECPLAETHAKWPALRRIRQAARQQGVLLDAAETQAGLSSFQAVFEDIDPHQGNLRQPGAGSSASLAVQGLDESLLAQHPYQRVPTGIETQLNR